MRTEVERFLGADESGSPRGKRLVRSLALSMLALFFVAAPFAQREGPTAISGMVTAGFGPRSDWQPFSKSSNPAMSMAAMAASPVDVAPAFIDPRSFDSRSLLLAPGARRSGQYLPLVVSARRPLNWSAALIPRVNYLSFSSYSGQ